MRFFVVAAVFGLAAPAPLAHNDHYDMSYNSNYDKPDASLKNVPCWTGEHGLLAHGEKLFKDLPTYPHVGGIPQIASEDSRYCRSCWELTYTDVHGHSKSVNYTAIDVGRHDFVTSTESFDYLTGSNGKKLKDFLITAVRKPEKWCGL